MNKTSEHLSCGGSEVTWEWRGCNLTYKLVFSFFFFLLLRKINQRGAPFPLRLSPTFSMLSLPSVIIRGHLLWLRLLSVTCILHPQHPPRYTFLPFAGVFTLTTINSCLESLCLIHSHCDGCAFTEPVYNNIQPSDGLSDAALWGIRNVKIRKHWRL